MQRLNPYLMFNGNCREAMEFYNRTFQGELQISTYGEQSGNAEYPEEAAPLVMHSILTVGGIVIMASDHLPGERSNAGDMISLAIDCSSKDELIMLFDKLSKAGKVSMPVQETFWGAVFGICTDAFGVQWMLNFDQPVAGDN